MTAEFHEGPGSAKRYAGAVKAILSVPKGRGVELEQKHKKTPERALVCASRAVV